MALIAANTATKASESIKLSGCLVKGEGGGGGYLLSNVPAQPALNNVPAGNAPSAVGTSGDFLNVFYWLEGSGDLQKHVGHQVEIEGDLKADPKDGEIKVDRKDRWSEVTVKADGRTMKARVPNTSVVASKDKDQKARLLVRRVDVEHVKMLGASCVDF
jgi:hypothetical protein